MWSTINPKLGLPQLHEPCFCDWLDAAIEGFGAVFGLFLVVRVSGSGARI